MMLFFRPIDSRVSHPQPESDIDRTSITDDFVKLTEYIIQLFIDDQFNFISLII